MIKLNAKNSKIICIIALGITIAIIILIAALKIPYAGNKLMNSEADATVSAEELEQYRKNIGDSMDIKKSILIIFNDSNECQSFISEHGSDENVLALGYGIIPQMQGGNGEQYFNCVGNAVFEPLFDAMKDGEFSEYPVEFGGAFCYFKRLQKYSVTDNDNDLKAFIQNERANQKGGEIE